MTQEPLTNQVDPVKDRLADMLASYSMLLDESDKMKLALAIGGSIYTVKRYLKGTVEEVRVLAVANKLIEAIEALLKKRKEELQNI